MKEWINDLSPGQTERLERERRSLDAEVAACASNVLDHIPDEAYAARVEAIAFTANDVLPKRRDRPRKLTAHVTNQLAQAYEVDDASRRTLLEFTVLVSEYYDALDDVLDGDVAPGRTKQALSATQMMMPLMVQYLHSMGSRAVGFWTERSIPMAGAWYVEGSEKPSRERYLTVVGQQANLVGSLTGLTAIVGEQRPEVVDRAETIGRTLFLFEQFLLDLKQHLGTDEDPWNAWKLLEEREVRDCLEDWRADVAELSAHLPDEHASMITALFATDVDRYRKTISA